MEEKLTKVNIVGEKYFHVFKTTDGLLVMKETTKEDYEQLGGKTPQNPTLKNGVWKYSLSRRHLDTATGYLEKGQYFVDGNSAVVFPVTDEWETGVPVALVVNDQISAENLFAEKEKMGNPQFVPVSSITVMKLVK